MFQILAAATGAAAAGTVGVAGAAAGVVAGAVPPTTWTLKPTLGGSDLPGTQVLRHLTEGFAGWALIAAVVGILIGAVMWAFGHFGHNYQQAYSGRKGVLISCLAAILIGGAQGIIRQLVSTGGGIH